MTRGQDLDGLVVRHVRDRGGVARVGGTGVLDEGLVTLLCPRRGSNPGTWLRRPMLYPLSYEGVGHSLPEVVAFS